MAKVISRVLHYVFSQTTVLAAAGRNRNEHSQYTEDSPHNYDSGLFKRDACADAFGSGWSANTCTPGTTLCCETVLLPLSVLSLTYHRREPSSTHSILPARLRPRMVLHSRWRMLCGLGICLWTTRRRGVHRAGSRRQASLLPTIYYLREWCVSKMALRDRI